MWKFIPKSRLEILLIRKDVSYVLLSDDFKKVSVNQINGILCAISLDSVLRLLIFC